MFHQPHQLWLLLFFYWTIVWHVKMVKFCNLDKWKNFNSLLSHGHWMMVFFVVYAMIKAFFLVWEGSYCNVYIVSQNKAWIKSTKINKKFTLTPIVMKKWICKTWSLFFSVPIKRVTWPNLWMNIFFLWYSMGI